MRGGFSGVFIGVRRRANPLLIRRVMSGSVESLRSRVAAGRRDHNQNMRLFLAGVVRGGWVGLREIFNGRGKFQSVEEKSSIVKKFVFKGKKKM